MSDQEKILSVLKHELNAAAASVKCLRDFYTPTRGRMESVRVTLTISHRGLKKCVGSFAWQVVIGPESVIGKFSLN